MKATRLYQLSYCFIGLLAAVLLGAPAARATASVVIAPEARKALPLFRNSHSTALANLASHQGLRKQGEPDRTLIATCWMYAQYCECDRQGKPTIWRVAEGARKILTARGYPRTSVAEKCLRTEKDTDRAQWPQVAGAIDRSHPVIVSFCYDEAAAKGLAQAKRREIKCFSALAIGYVTNNGRHYLICQDGLAAGQTSVASVDRVAPKSIGLPAKGVWSEPGTGIYKWDGKHTNLVFVFVGTPQR